MAKSSAFFYAGAASRLCWTLKYAHHDEILEKIKRKLTNIRVTVLLTKDRVKDLIDTDLFECIHGKYADGTEYYILDDCKYVVIPEPVEVDSQYTYNGVDIPGVDWLYQAFKEGKYIPSVKGDESYLEVLTTEFKERGARLAKQRQEARDKAIVELGLELSEEIISLYERVVGFDHYFTYSDDIGVFRRWSKEEKELIELLKPYPSLMGIFKPSNIKK